MQSPLMEQRNTLVAVPTQIGLVHLQTGYILLVLFVHGILPPEFGEASVIDVI